MPTPYLIRPLEWGADIVVHSLTKFLGGHGNSIGGAIVDGGTFDFGASGRFPGFTEPDPSYHGLAYWPALGPGSYIIKARVQLLRDIGAPISPFNAFLILQGIETLSLRMERHFANAQKVAEYLVGQGQVLSVNYAGLPDSPWHERAKKLGGGKGYGSVLAFEIEGGLEAGKRFVEALELHSHVANIGDVRSLVIHPASTTHSQLTARGAAGLRRPPRPGPPQRRPGDDRRHPRRPRQGLRGRQGLILRSPDLAARRGQDGVRTRRRVGSSRWSLEELLEAVGEVVGGAQRGLGAAVVLDLQHPHVGAAAGRRSPTSLVVLGGPAVGLLGEVDGRAARRARGRGGGSAR